MARRVRSANCERLRDVSSRCPRRKRMTAGAATGDGVVLLCFCR
jgi:hypothetical protein